MLAAMTPFRDTTLTFPCSLALFRTWICVLLLLLTTPPLSGVQTEDSARSKGAVKRAERATEKIERYRSFQERMRRARDQVGRGQILERMVEMRERAIERYRDRLDISDKEWTIIQPRLRKVYKFVHPVRLGGGQDEQSKNAVQQKSSELRQLLQDQGASTPEIKAGITALRQAKEQSRQQLIMARQELRTVLSVRQEAQLILSGLLD